MGSMAHPKISPYFFYVMYAVKSNKRTTNRNDKRTNEIMDLLLSYLVQKIDRDKAWSENRERFSVGEPIFFKAKK